MRDWTFVDKAVLGNDRSPQWVVGIEGDVGTANKSTTLPGRINPGTANSFFGGNAGDMFGVRSTWDASVPARAGYLFTLKEDSDL